MRRRDHRAGLLLASAIGCGSAAFAGETIVYGYDSLGRLVRVEHSGTVNNGAGALYSYDSADNRTRVTAAARTAGSSAAAAPAVSPDRPPARVDGQGVDGPCRGRGLNGTTGDAVPGGSGGSATAAAAALLPGEICS